ncbi:pre-mRNA-splicing ATP-dependent RNA helicase prp28 [Phoenix dactylifera]|uniref:Pre-mRNA-splicing ATP-dependent RNA helicase prp28 n=1 Tax=Phoenix dactylifera TaxID=42345 RepID=A0A8B7CKI5_PHODC|nr:pre-mRNA-splicing ATP-dependent RNA helicase prp28 [Phoenix dactylifera]
MPTVTGKHSPPPAPPPNLNPNALPNTPALPSPQIVSRPRLEQILESSPPPPPPLSLPLLASPMGHGQSKPEPWMELRPGMRPIRRKIEEVKRRRRERKLSIVSSSELLRPEEREEMVDDESTRGAAGTEAGQEDEVAGSPEAVAAFPTAAEKVNEEKTIDDEEKAATAVEEKETGAAAATAVLEKEEEEEKRGLGFRGQEEDDEKGKKLRSFAADEEPLGSPSFRFYCMDLARDSEADSSVKFGGNRRRDKLPEIMEKKEKKAHGRENSTESVNSNENLEIKPLKKDKGRRLKALTKAPSHVYNLLNVRNCYNNTSSTTSRDKDSLLGGKAAL